MMPWLSLARPLALVALLAGLFWGFEAYTSHEYGLGYGVGRAELKAQYDAQLAAATAQAHAEEDIRRTATETSHAQDLHRATIQVADGLAARTELGRLRDRLSRPDPAPTCADTAPGPVPDVSATYRELLGTCADRYESVAGDAGRLADQVIGLQGYVRAACLVADEIGGDSPAGERPRAGFSSLATQPATEPPRPAPGGATPPPTVGAP